MVAGLTDDRNRDLDLQNSIRLRTRYLDLNIRKTIVEQVKINILNLRSFKWIFGSDRLGKCAKTGFFA